MTDKNKAAVNLGKIAAERKAERKDPEKRKKYEFDPSKPKNPDAVSLGQLSAAARKEKGHDSEYYRNLANKRWNK